MNNALINAFLFGNMSFADTQVCFYFISSSGWHQLNSMEFWLSNHSQTAITNQFDGCIIVNGVRSDSGGGPSALPVDQCNREAASAGPVVACEEERRVVNISDKVGERHCSKHLWPLPVKDVAHRLLEWLASCWCGSLVVDVARRLLVWLAGCWCGLPDVGVAQSLLVWPTGC